MDDDKSTIDIDKELPKDVISITSDTIPVNISAINMSCTIPHYYSYSGTGLTGYTSGNVLTSNGYNGTWATSSAPSSTIKVEGDAEFNGDIQWKGRSLGKLLETIEDRLAILTPDPAKLEKYEALKKAYEHYKLLEKLIGED